MNGVELLPNSIRLDKDGVPRATARPASEARVRRFPTATAVVGNDRIHIPDTPKIRLESLNLDPPAGLTIQPL